MRRHGFGRDGMSAPNPETSAVGFTLAAVRRQHPTVRIECRILTRRIDDHAFKIAVSESARARDLLRAAGWTVVIPHPGSPTLLVTAQAGTS